MRSCVCRKVETALRIQIIGSKAQLASELIGIEDGRYLMIKMPPIYSMVDASGLLYKGNTIFVRYLHNDTVFGFQSQISNFIIKAELIFIYYPNKIENYDLRGHKRIDCFCGSGVKLLSMRCRSVIKEMYLIDGRRKMIVPNIHLPAPPFPVHLLVTLSAQLLRLCQNGCLSRL